ncbi:hypothetical protein [Silvimonas iriomotensis]|uniref:hypothetical protein n=1 Tax=Silvimonas iriomotensis TaxID=449662 RepID=UPI00166887E9|nr:hypothetical protein [Silvimonas iriomotensis]
MKNIVREVDMNRPLLAVGMAAGLLCAAANAAWTLTTTDNTSWELIPETINPGDVMDFLLYTGTTSPYLTTYTQTFATPTTVSFDWGGPDAEPWQNASFGYILGGIDHQLATTATTSSGSLTLNVGAGQTFGWYSKLDSEQY